MAAYLPLLKLAPLIGSSFFASSCLYISLVDAPARHMLDPVNALRHFKGIFRRIEIPGYAVLSGITAGMLAFMTGAKIWLLGAGLILANIPYTICFLFALNGRLLALPEDKADSRTLADLEHWNKMHTVRTLLGMAAVGVFAYANL